MKFSVNENKGNSLRNKKVWERQINLTELIIIFSDNEIFNSVEQKSLK